MIDGMSVSEVEYQVKGLSWAKCHPLFSSNNASVQQCSLTFHMLYFYCEHPPSSQNVIFPEYKGRFLINKLLSLKNF